MATGGANEGDRMTKKVDLEKVFGRAKKVDRETNKDDKETKEVDGGTKETKEVDGGTKETKEVDGETKKTKEADEETKKVDGKTKKVDRATKKVDLERMIDKWARDYFERNSTFKERRLLKQGMVSLEIDWKRVKFLHDGAVYTWDPPASGSGTPTNYVLFNTTFTNHTAAPQTYTFRTQRTTQSSCTIAVERGCVTGAEVNVKLSIPTEILELGAGFKREIELKDTDSATVMEELTWGVDSQIVVNGNHIGEAKLIILEEEYKGGFEVKTHISGVARVIFTNLKNNNSFMKAIERPVADIVNEAMNGIPTEAMSVVKESDKIIGLISRTKGKCHFRFGAKQIVKINETSICRRRLTN